MRANTSTGTTPERSVRRLLRTGRVRFSSHYKRLPGTPDFILLNENVALFVHGCFWHSHGCQPIRLPKTNRAYWNKKLARNVFRDKGTKRLLRKAGWRPVTVWECQIKSLTVQNLLKKVGMN